HYTSHTHLLILSTSLLHHRHLPLSLHDALPISLDAPIDVYMLAKKSPTLGSDTGQAKAFLEFMSKGSRNALACPVSDPSVGDFLDRKSTRLNSSHVAISYAVFCLKKKNKTK